MVLICTLCFKFLNFQSILRDIYEFSWFYSIYFWILVETCSYKSLEGFHAIFEIFGFLYEQWSKIGVGIEKIGRIQTCQIFGSADGPRVSGGQSAVNWTCSSEALQRSCQPQKFIADSPPKNRGQSAYAGQILPEAVSVSWQCKKFKGGRSARLSRTVREWTERWGRPDFTYIGCPSHSPPPNRTQTSKSSLYFSLNHVGETTRSRLFGVVPGRSEHIPGLFSRLCIMSSRYFNESLTLVLGFLYWKELGLDAPIFFLDHSFLKILEGSYS